MQLKNLKTKFLGKNIIHYKEIDSTQSEIWRLIQSRFAQNGTLVMADIQTNGKGTHGRTWYTDEIGNIAFSFFIEMNCNIRKLEGITIEIAKTIVDILKTQYKIKLDIKEPNDIVFNSKKIGGILTETKVISENVKYLVIGIGINTKKQNFTKDIENTATSIKKEFNVDINREKFITEFCNRFETDLYERIENEMKIAFLFPGQGSQYIGMGKDIYEKYEIAKNIYDKVQELTGIDIAKISFEGLEEKLNETKYTQLAILTMSLSILEILKSNNIEAEMSAGLSLGEYTALINSGAISFEEGVKLVQKRGEYMQELLPKGDWQMSAIMGLADEQVEEICKKVESGFVVPANYNCIGQVAISGEKEAIEEAGKIAKEMGAKKVIPLKTAGPFHTEKLIESSKALRKELEKVAINKFKTKVIKNLDGEIYKDTDDVKDILSKHIINPVKFSKTIQNMLDNGIDTFIEIGSGKSLSGFVKRTPTDREIRILNINNIESLKNTINLLENN